MEPLVSPQRHEFRFLDPLRVRWAEVDLQRIVFNGHYLMYFDTAVAGWWRDMALPYHDAMQTLEGDLYVRKATVEYEASAQYDDALRVGVKTQRVGNSSLLLRCAVFKGPKALVHGELVYVFADPRTQKSQPVPQALRDVLQRYEAGDAMTSARIGTWESLSAEIVQLRRALAPADIESLAPSFAACHDGAATHVVLVNRLAQTVAAVRLWSQQGGRFQLDGLTVHPALRGAGFVDELVRTARDAARHEGATSLSIDAPAGLAPTLERHGLQPGGSTHAAVWSFGGTV
jgi:YbgC/YbaW family acyl-CoA thioester hydrolase